MKKEYITDTAETLQDALIDKTYTLSGYCVLVSRVYRFFAHKGIGLKSKKAKFFLKLLWRVFAKVSN